MVCEYVYTQGKHKYMYTLTSNTYSNKHILICLGLMICEHVYTEAEHIYVYIHAKHVFKQTNTCMFGLDGM